MHGVTMKFIRSSADRRALARVVKRGLHKLRSTPGIATIDPMILLRGG